MKLNNKQYQLLLSNIPGTGLVLFNRDFEILLFQDNRNFIEAVTPGNSSPRGFSDLDDSDLKKTFLDLAGKMFNNIDDPEKLVRECSSLIFQGIPLRDSNGKVEIGAIFFLKGYSDPEISKLTLIRDKEDARRAMEGAEKDRKYAEKARASAEKDREDAEEASLVKSDFIASISHEIRTPLNAIIGFTEQLQKTGLNDKQSKYLTIVDKSATYLLDLVNEILTFSKVESGEIQLDEVDFQLNSLVTDVYNTFKSRADSKKIKLKYEVDEELQMIFRGDELRLKQIITNLVSNAIKFTEYGFVKLFVKKKSIDKDLIWILFEVRDTGTGIPENKIGEIFTEFKQVDAGITKKHGGTGLGLTISKRLTELMNGRISVKSTKGRGSVFTVEIPLKKSPLKSISDNRIEIRKDILSGYRVLIVDDDGLNRLLGKTILEDLNVVVDLAEDGREALEMIGTNDYDVILLDIHMPEMSGFDVAHYIRHEKKNRRVKIIAVTADILKSDLKRIPEEGINDFLIKPYREINLYNRICKVLDLEIEEIKVEFTEVGSPEFITARQYDLSELRKVTRDDDSFFYEMIKTFIGNAIEGIRLIKAAQKDKDWETISEAAHKMIPSYKHIEAKVVVADLIELKNMCMGTPDSVIASKLINKISDSTDDIIESLNNEKS